MGILESLVPSQHFDAIFMTAAVADYAPSGAYAVQRRVKNVDGTETWIVRNAQAAKIKSNHETIAITGQRTEKIVDRFRSQWAHRGLLVKFKLEVGIDAQELIAVGQASRRASGAEYLIANTLEMTTGHNAGAYLLSDAGSEWIARDALAARCAALCATA